MHTFLKAIGFSKKTSQADIDNLIGEVVDRAESNKVIQKSNGCKFVEYSKEFGAERQMRTVSSGSDIISRTLKAP